MDWTAGLQAYNKSFLFIVMVEKRCKPDPSPLHTHACTLSKVVGPVTRYKNPYI